MSEPQAVLGTYAGRLESLAASLNVPGVSVALLHDGVVETAWAGVLHSERAQEVREDSRFQIGSITKVLTTALVMQLVDEGSVDLEGAVVDYLPEFRLADPDATRAIAVRHLLSHTSGIPGDWFPDLGPSATVEEYVATLADLQPTRPAGGHYDYSNAGFAVAGRLVEVVTGRTWADALDDRLVGPLGIDMAATADPAEPDGGALAMGHLPLDIARPLDGLKPAPVYASHPECASIGATPVATARALITFARLFIDGGCSADGTQVLPASAVRQMAEKRVPIPAAGLDGPRWVGLGWGVADWGDEIVLQHRGATLGQASSLTVMPGRGVALAVLTNGPGGNLVARAVESDLFSQTTGLTSPPLPQPGRPPPAIDPEPYVGTYESVGARIDVTRGENGQLRGVVTELSGLDPAAGPVEFPPITLTPIDADTLACSDGTVFSMVERDELGRHQYLFTGRLHRRAS